MDCASSTNFTDFIQFITDRAINLMSIENNGNFFDLLTSPCNIYVIHVIKTNYCISFRK